MHLDPSSMSNNSLLSERLLATIERTSLLVTETDAQGVITFVNPAAQRFFGYTPAECIGKTVLELTHPADRDRLQQTIIECVRDGRHLAEIENRILHRDGSVFHFLWSVAIHYSDQGTIIGFTSIGQDISALHQLRSELYEKREMLYTVIDHLPLGVFWKDKESRFLGCNRRVLEDSGLSSFKDIIGKTDFELPWRRQATYYQYSDRVVMASGPQTNIEETLVRGDGRQIWIRTTKLPLRRQGEVIGVLSFYEDITEQRQQNEYLRTLRLLVENAPDGIGIVDPDLRLTYTNQAFIELLGYEQLVGIGWPDLVHPDDREHLVHMVRRATTGEAAHGTLRYLRRDGSFLTVQVAIPVLRDRTNKLMGFGVINHDLTEQLEAMARLQASEQQQRALLQALPDLMFLLSRDGVFLQYKADGSDELAVRPEVFLHRRFDEVLPPVLAELTRHHLEIVNQTGQPQRYEYQLEIGGELHDYEARMHPSGDNVLVLVRDITEQRRAERERQTLILQEQIIQAQLVVLRELSTPLLPIANGVVVMPLIGTIDSSRAQQVMETLLDGVNRYQATVAIIDITGVKVVDTQVAGALIRTAQAASLLGAQVVLSGINPEIAQTLVQLSIDLAGIVTKATLQDGIAYALSRQQLRTRPVPTALKMVR
ncbi:PAS domain S-box protein [Chloroflexus aggregans]|uniref:PAS/PAC sensor protein n=1 Tax=Chloroflexus aggregans (strain MD-66 / DSM 9485) TaxID=326427 RepID=B8G4P3_CHLAD|nr:PAS domain S-box protein [Chloroflexus aggregans]ACL25519.1 putative PAS/PAC sensor protein [Chloroflexus aggregans DSM 9485]